MSLRERLAAPTRLLLAPTSTGSIEARRWSADGWQAGTAELRITTGELVATTDRDGRLVVTDFGVGFAPIALPLGEAAALSQVRLDLVAPPEAATTTWSGDDAATAQTSFELILGWSLSVDGTSAPLGSQHLAPVTVALGFDGDGTSVDATLAVAAPGTIWSWAGIVELAELQLALAAATP